MTPTTKRTLGFIGGALMTTAIAAPASAQSAQPRDRIGGDPRDRIFALEQRVNEMENRGGVKVAPGTTFEFGGYVKLDFTYDFEQTQGFSVGGSTLGVGRPDDGGFRAQARESRFNVKSTTQTDTGPVTALIEFDFFNGDGNELISNSNRARLRLAYGTWNGFLAGQNWSLFMPIAFGAAQVNFAGPVGTVFLRHPQVRYTFPEMETASGSFTAAVSLESSENSARFDDPNFGAGGLAAPSIGGSEPKTDQLPDLIGAVTWTNGVQRAKVAGMLTELNSPIGSDSEIGYGVNLAFATPLWAGSDFRGSFNWGDGLGRYILSGGIGNAGIIDTTTGNLDTIEIWGGQLSLRQTLTDTISISFAGGFFRAEDRFAPTDRKEQISATTTVFYEPNSKTTMGLQFLWLQAENDRGAQEAASRLQFSTQFRF